MNPTIAHLGPNDVEAVLLRVERGECNSDDANLLRNYIRALEARLADYEHDCLYWGGNSVPENTFQLVAEKHE